MPRKILEKIRDGLKHPIIYTALVGGACMVIQSLVYKRYLHVEVNGLVAVLPSLIFGVYAVLSLAGDLPETRKKTDPRILKLLNPLVWNLLIIITTLLSIAIPYFRQN